MNDLFKYLEGFCESVEETEELERVCQRILDKHGRDVLRRHLAALQKRIIHDEVTEHFRVTPLELNKGIPQLLKPFLVLPDGVGERIPLGVNSIYNFDHVKRVSSKRTNRNILVNEPYEISMESLDAIINTCKENDLTFHITGRSLHFPNWTVGMWIKKGD